MTTTIPTATPEALAAALDRAQKRLEERRGFHADMLARLAEGKATAANVGDTAQGLKDCEAEVAGLQAKLDAARGANIHATMVTVDRNALALVAEAAAGNLSASDEVRDAAVRLRYAVQLVADDDVRRRARRVNEEVEERRAKQKANGLLSRARAVLQRDGVTYRTSEMYGPSLTGDRSKGYVSGNVTKHGAHITATGPSGFRDSIQAKLEAAGFKVERQPNGVLLVPLEESA